MIPKKVSGQPEAWLVNENENENEEKTIERKLTVKEMEKEKEKEKEGSTFVYWPRAIYTVVNKVCTITITHGHSLLRCYITQLFVLLFSSYLSSPKLPLLG